MIISGSFGFIAFSFMKAQGGSEIFDQPIDKNLPEGFHFAFSMFRYFEILAFLQVILAGGLLVSAIQFLKLREWARKVLEGFGWFSISFVVLFTIFWIVIWTSIIGQIPDDQSSKIPVTAFAWIGPIMAVIINGFHSAAIILAIKFLRSAKIKNAMIH